MTHNECEAIGISRRWLIKQLAAKIGRLAVAIYTLLSPLLLLLLPKSRNPIASGGKAFFAFFAVVGGLILTAIWGKSLLVTVRRLLAGERLLIGDIGLQVIDKYGKVIGNLPYDNVELMELYRRSQKEERIGVILRLRDDANTVWLCWDSIR